MKNRVKKHFSVIYMEAAPYGDLSQLIQNKKFDFDEKLIRTIFH